MADLNSILASLQQSVGFAAGQSRKALEAVADMQGAHALVRQELQRQQRDMQNMADILSRTTATAGGGPGGLRPPNLGTFQYGEYVLYIDQIPGRRIPYDLVVTIPIGANIASEQQQTDTISQDGPFVGVARYASFQSAFQFTRTDPFVPGAVPTFQGRSYGRFRPIHSAWDINDAGVPFNVIAPIAFPGTGAPVYASPSNHSNFRTMEFDGLIEFLNQGSAWPRQRSPVPSTFWSTQINAPFQLGALDFFERGETLQWKVTPSHVNNPNAGNASGYGSGGFYPFLPSQYDVHEGVVDPQLLGPPPVSSDPVNRLPEGFLYIGMHGFRIIQPPGPIRLT